MRTEESSSGDHPLPARNGTSDSGMAPHCRTKAQETAINGVVVHTDAAGTSRFAGPPSYGGDFTSSALQDLSSTNPANAYGRKRWPYCRCRLVHERSGD